MEVRNKSIIKPMTMTLYSGREVDIFNLNLKDIDIEDIAHALSNLCRYGGHCLFHYSVALHSYLCSLEEGTREEQLAFLLHDASEAFVNDLVRPIKHRPEFEHYRLEEDKIQRIVFEKFELEYPFSQRVHDVDNHILRTELKAVVINRDEISACSSEKEISLREARKFLRKEKKDNCVIPQISPLEAEELFLNRFYELYEKT
jgi:5'-deoxynucleotidase YfbR-like HD superfamily hydrolase